MSRSGSDKRQRVTPLSARFNNQEAEEIREMADRAGTSVASVIRGAVLNAPVTRATRRPTVNHKLAARVLGELQRIAETLRTAIASGRADPKDPYIAAAFRDLSEMRTVCFLAMGREP
jgi:Mobilization protein NikA